MFMSSSGPREVSVEGGTGGAGAGWPLDEEEIRRQAILRQLYRRPTSDFDRHFTNHAVPRTKIFQQSVVFVARLEKSDKNSTASFPSLAGNAIDPVRVEDFEDSSNHILPDHPLISSETSPNPAQKVLSPVAISLAVLIVLLLLVAMALVLWHCSQMKKLKKVFGKRRKQHTDEKQPNGRLKGSLESVVVLASSPGKKKKGGYFSSVEVKTAVIRRSSCRATQMPRSHSVPLRDGGCLSFAQKPDSDDESGGEEDTYRPAESGQPSAGGHRESRYHTFHHSTSIPLQTSSRVSYNARSGSVDFAESSNSLHRLSRIIGAQNETYHHFPSPSVESIPMPTMTSTPTCGRSSVGRSYSPGYYTTPRPPSSSSNTHSQAPTPFGRMELSNSSDNVLNESRPRGRPGVPMVTSVSRPSSLSRCPELDSVVKSRSLPHCARNRQLTLASGSLPLENTGLGITRDLRHQVMAETAAALAEATSPSYPHPMPLVGNTRILPSPSATTSSGCSSSSYAPPNKYATLSSFSGSSGSDSRHGSNATLPTSRSRQSLVAAYTGTVIVYDERTEL